MCVFLVYEQQSSLVTVCQMPMLETPWVHCMLEIVDRFVSYDALNFAKDLFRRVKIR